MGAPFLFDLGYTGLENGEEIRVRRLIEMVFRERNGLFPFKIIFLSLQPLDYLLEPLLSFFYVASYFINKALISLNVLM